MRLKELRVEKGLYQREVAEALNIAPTTYLSYEKGINEPSLNMLGKLADFFGVTVDELIGRSSTPAMFDDARVERPEILELFEQLSPAQQQNLLNYARGMAVANQLEEDAPTKKLRA